MIPVDTTRLAHLLPGGWLSKATELQVKLDKAASPEEAAAILKQNAHWRALNEALRNASNYKCWYSETRHVTARMDIDHFRPIGTVRERDGSTRPGHPYLAYEFRNYRLSAQLMNQRTREGENSRGKHQQFPLLAGTTAATDRAGVVDEKPLLLDPTAPGDPGLLTFNEQGEALSAVAAEHDSVGHERATCTIDALWLDRRALAENRKVAWTEAHQAIVRSERFAENARKLTGAGNHSEAVIEWGAYRRELKSLRDKARPTREFSAAVRACLRASGRPWAFRIAERVSRLSLLIAPSGSA